ncbi:DUF2515 domain-containing protein [Bacillus sp. DTU_2020_1000418_1_SI_GHA_SEK_038]|uniref:DUF2515 domain-containing protein n=1 Tax=Bacillus sp. DTU_2020_1000418_1_SI_GHA_SEK_038 TaxID=3077585 RepID=UPI0028ECBDA9|nr:DUF2515 domain-containing protein [Bacillus sp. DTU_2020_1000418_1_SI_GHA_SEK_038]WNS73995.1 DUF2515 domain-containing protein [Bacillus sp. DTU_2020_1000418_1_SI_GHA_SEK_038]
MFFERASYLNGLSIEELELIRKIKSRTQKYNADNISRTNAYFHYYNRNPEVIWSFLASMVSRNAGWNMCDLEGKWFPKIINKKFRKKLFLTYERANWLIFQDAFPQLLLYQYSTKMNRPMFHLLKFFHVSIFMEREWRLFWEQKCIKRLLISQIINEQNIIQKPVLKHPAYKNKVFRSPQFLLQDWFHYSSVIFPTCEGLLYGASVNGFKSLSKRIDLGKRLADILFNKDLYPSFYQFAKQTVHTGSRYDYEIYFKNRPSRTTPFLRCTFPLIKHRKLKAVDWSKNRRLKRKWFKENVEHNHPIELTEWYINKQTQIKKAISLKEIVGVK